MVKEEHLSGEPRMPRSDQKISQERFPGETPLTGEDLPSDKAGYKQEGWDPAHDRQLNERREVGGET